METLYLEIKHQKQQLDRLVLDVSNPDVKNYLEEQNLIIPTDNLFMQDVLNKATHLFKCLQEMRRYLPRKSFYMNMLEPDIMAISNAIREIKNKTFMPDMFTGRKLKIVKFLDKHGCKNPRLLITFKTVKVTSINI